MGLQPSIAAASSKVKERFWKKESIKKMVNGTFIAMYRKMIRPRVLVSFMLVMTENRGMMIIMTGMPSAVANMFCRNMLPRNLKREST